MPKKINDEIDRIIKIGRFEIYGKRRKTPNEFTELADKIEKFKIEVITTIVKFFYIDRLSIWLEKHLAKKD